MVGKISAEASYASKLANPRNINGVPNGSNYRLSLWNKYGTAVHFISELS